MNQAQNKYRLSNHCNDRANSQWLLVKYHLLALSARIVSVVPDAASFWETTSSLKL